MDDFSLKDFNGNVGSSDIGFIDSSEESFLIDIGSLDLNALSRDLCRKDCLMDSFKLKNFDSFVFSDFFLLFSNSFLESENTNFIIS